VESECTNLSIAIGVKVPVANPTLMSENALLSEPISELALNASKYGSKDQAELAASLNS
jgi:hypothetical protein